jgi:hypothetical protein
MNPPRVYDETTPNNHNTKRMTKIVHNIVHLRDSSFLRDFSFLPISTLGRHARAAGCSHSNEPGQKEHGAGGEMPWHQLLTELGAAQSFSRQ